MALGHHRPAQPGDQYGPWQYRSGPPEPHECYATCAEFADVTLGFLRVSGRVRHLAGALGRRTPGSSRPPRGRYDRPLCRRRGLLLAQMRSRSAEPPTPGVFLQSPTLVDGCDDLSEASASLCLRRRTSSSQVMVLPSPSRWPSCSMASFYGACRGRPPRQQAAGRCVMSLA
jgi:hypothetical protein